MRGVFSRLNVRKCAQRWCQSSTKKCHVCGMNIFQSKGISHTVTPDKPFTCYNEWMRYITKRNKTQRLYRWQNQN